MHASASVIFQTLEKISNSAGKTRNMQRRSVSFKCPGPLSQTDCIMHV